MARSCSLSVHITLHEIFIAKFYTI